MPSDEPVGAQLPALLSLLGTAQGTQLAPIQIVRAGGDILDLERSLVQQEVLDGEIVRITTDDEVPPPTEVSDISGLLTDMTDEHPGRWNDRSRLIGAGTLLAVSAVAAAWAAPRDIITTLPPWSLLVPGLVTMLLAAVISQGRSSSSREIGALSTFLAFGLLIPAICTLAMGPVNDRLLAVAASLTAVALAVLGRGNVGWAFGAMVGMALYGVWIAFNMVAIAPLGDGLTAVTALVCLGILPWLALLVSGTSRLDDAALAGALPSRRRVLQDLTTAHETLAGSCLAAAAVLSWSATVLASSSNAWARALCAAVVIATLLRSRAFPLRSEVLSLWLAVIPPALVLSGAVTQPAARAAVLLLTGLVLASLSLYRPAPQTRVRLRRLGTASNPCAWPRPCPSCAVSVACSPTFWGCSYEPGSSSGRRSRPARPAREHVRVTDPSGRCGARTAQRR